MPGFWVILGIHLVLGIALVTPLVLVPVWANTLLALDPPGAAQVLLWLTLAIPPTRFSEPPLPVASTAGHGRSRILPGGGRAVRHGRVAGHRYAA